MLSAWRSRLRQYGLRTLQTRSITQSRGHAQKTSIFRKIWPEEPQTPLAEELFPKRVEQINESNIATPNENAENLALPLPTIEELLEGYRRRLTSYEVTKKASSNAFRQENTAVLVLQAASKSLTEDDFRRLTPKGTHIDEWTGPGTIEKVFPSRDPITLEQSEHYFLVFRNPAHARAYQSNVMRLYRHARAVTPKSLGSPLPPQPGSRPSAKFSDPEAEDDPFSEPEDAATMLADFALISPHQRLQLTYMYPPLSPSLMHLIDRNGYLGTRAGRAVALWVDGPQAPGPGTIEEVLRLDGERRGLHWELEELERIKTRTKESEDDSQGNGNGDVYAEDVARTGRARWLLTFSSEDETKRFMRSWHMRPVRFTLEEQEDHLEREVSIVHLEFLW